LIKILIFLPILIKKHQRELHRIEKYRHLTWYLQPTMNKKHKLKSIIDQNFNLLTDSDKKASERASSH
jgi:hypothetical protein